MDYELNMVRMWTMCKGCLNGRIRPVICRMDDKTLPHAHDGFLLHPMWVNGSHAQRLATDGTWSESDGLEKHCSRGSSRPSGYFWPLLLDPEVPCDLEQALGKACGSRPLSLLP